MSRERIFPFHATLSILHFEQVRLIGHPFFSTACQRRKKLSYSIDGLLNSPLQDFQDKSAHHLPMHPFILEHAIA